MERIDRRTAAAAWRIALYRLPAVCLTLAATGCGAATVDKTIGFGPSDVDRIEVYRYLYSQSPTKVRMAEVTNRREVATVVDAFTEVRGVTVSDPVLDGAQAAGVRFVLRDGSTVEATQVFKGPGDVVILWQDGEAFGTQWGSPIDAGGHGEPVDPALRPEGGLP